ncbi:unnamed protein product [Durusdinium trenchii]|uniref:U6 snRNA-associated Sm-like protein LSm4 n=1 Tax=Durusdinium trenchii TaxID=1381693 RepID=A0ABP0K1E6_9DINO
MVLPQAVLRSASHGPALVELKNGDSYSGTLVAVDNFMNIRLEDAVFTPRLEQKFEHMKECTIRGQFVKFIRFPDNILDRHALDGNIEQRVTLTCIQSPLMQFLARKRKRSTHVWSSMFFEVSALIVPKN